jgi:indole-3-glycerol phosphate synthase
MRGGAAAISVLTEPEFFRGSLEDLRAARQATDLPLLCKDFILDPFQIYQARAYGADAVLLIAAILSLPELSLLIQVAHSLGMAALVEVHNEEEARKALAAEAALIGINNRDLRDFSVTLETTLRIRPLIPSAVPVVSESGIRSREDVLALQEVGVNAILVGESLVTAPDPVAKIKELLGGEEEKP